MLLLFADLLEEFGGAGRRVIQLRRPDSGAASRGSGSLLGYEEAILVDWDIEVAAGGKLSGCGDDSMVFCVVWFFGQQQLCSLGLLVELMVQSLD